MSIDAYILRVPTPLFAPLFAKIIEVSFCFFIGAQGKSVKAKLETWLSTSFGRLLKKTELN